MAKTKTTIPPNNIRVLRQAKRLTMQQLADVIGVDASRINKIEKSQINVTQDKAIAIARALDVPLDELFRTAADEAKAGIGSETQGMPRDQIGILGIAAGSFDSGAVQITEGPVDYLPRPKALENARGIYGLYVSGASMQPMFRHGTIILANPYKPPKVGDAVVVQERFEETESIRASIGILDSQNGDIIKLMKLNPVGFIEIKRQYMLAMHKIVDYGELIGMT